MTRSPTAWSSSRRRRPWTTNPSRPRPPPARSSSRPSPPRAWPLPDLAGPGVAVVVLGLVSAASWGAGDFGGGMLTRRAPLFGVVFGSQLVGLVAALAIGIARGEPPPHGTDVAWCVAAGACGVLGITALYRGLSVGRMGVVAPTTGVLAVVIPVTVGFALEGLPPPQVIAGIAVALVAVVLVTRAPGHEDGRPSGLEWGLLGGLGIGLFNVCIGSCPARAPSVRSCSPGWCRVGSCS